MKTVLETLQGGTDYLDKRGVESARLNMQLMLAQVLECSKLELYLQFDRPLEEGELAPLRELLKRRGQREPLQHVLGEVEFFKHTFKSDKRALIPRPETEELVEFLTSSPLDLAPDSWVIDVGTGSGVIGLSLAMAWQEQGFHFLLIDQHDAALSLAKENAIALELDTPPVHFREGDLLGNSDEEASVIVANLPYIPTQEISTLSAEVQHDPPSALDGGDDGLDLVRRLIKQAKQRLLPDGLIALEIGIDQAQKGVDLLASEGYKNILIRQDLSGVDRFLLANKA